MGEVVLRIVETLGVIGASTVIYATWQNMGYTLPFIG